MGYLHKNWLRVLIVSLGIYFITLAVVFVFFDRDDTAGQRAVGALITLVPAVALFVGLWLTDRGRATAAKVAISIGLLGTLVFWWMIFPVLAALAVLWFGLIRGGLSPKTA